MKKRPSIFLFLCSIAGSLTGFYCPVSWYFLLGAFFLSLGCLAFSSQTHFAKISLLLFSVFWLTSFSASYYKNKYFQTLDNIPNGNQIYSGQISETYLHEDGSKSALFKTYAGGYLNLRLKLKDEASKVDISQSSKISVKGKINKFSEPLSFFHFDGPKYGLSKNFHGTLVVKDNYDVLVHKDHKKSLVESIKNSLEQFVLFKLTPHDASVLLALMLGNTYLFDNHQKEIFSTIGAQHILAVSGLQVSLIAAVVYFVFYYLLLLILPLKYLHLSRPLCAIFALFFIWGFISLCGFPISAVRAGIMSTIILSSLFVLRRVDVFDAFFVSGTGILLLDPKAILDLGFLLSYSAVFALLLCHKLTKNLVSRVKNKSWFFSYVLLLFLSCMSAFLATTPFLLATFALINPFSIFANFFIMPIASICQTIAIIFGFLSFGLDSKMLLVLASFCANCIEIIAEFLSQIIPEGIYFNFSSGFLFFWASLLFVAFSLLLARKVLLCLGFIGAFFLLSFSFSPFSPSELVFSFLPVGQGDATFIACPNGTNILVDAGGNFDFRYDPGKLYVVPLLKRKQVKKLHVLAITHPDADHILGAFSVLENFLVEEVWVVDEHQENDNLLKFLTVVKQKQIPIKTIEDLNKKPLWFGETKVELLGPSLELSQCSKKQCGTNNKSMVLKFSFKGTSFLLPGDIEKNGEDHLMKKQKNIRAQVLKAPHHGSNTSSGKKFIETVNPEIVIFSTGQNNRFGFPHEKVIERYQKQGCRLLDTKLDGEIQVFLREDSLIVKTYKEGLGHWYNSR